jgi:SAM-dependent methyltransferase
MNKIENTVGIDINPKSQANIIHNLDKFPYPFKANQFEKVIADNIIEHLDNIPRVCEELHRISKNGAKVFITTGHFSSLDSFTDPTHKHFFTTRSFDYFIPGTDLYKYEYSKAKFKKIKVTVGDLSTTNLLLKLLLLFINKHVIWYEKRCAFIFPVGVISYELEVVK